MMQTNEVLERYAFVNTGSMAGSPVKVTFRASEVVEMRKWYNHYGNPSYTVRLDRGDRMETLYLVDDYGAENGLRSVNCYRVDKHKDLFRGWL